MSIQLNEARRVTLHRRDGDAATPLHPATCADAVSYSNADADAAFAGVTAREALDELFRRLGVVEGEVLPPVAVVPRLLAPVAEQRLAEGEALTLTSTPFAVRGGKDTHAASEWRITGADARPLWSSGEDAAHLESFPDLPVNRETLPEVAGVPDGEGMSVTGYPCFDSLLNGDSAYDVGTAGGNGTFLLWNAQGNADRQLRMLTRSVDGGTNWERVACDDAERFSSIVWTGTRFLAFMRSNTSPSPVMASTDGGDSWTQVGSLPIKNLGITRAAAQDGVIVAVSNATTLYRSEDDGVTWNPVSCPLTAGSIMTAHGHFVCNYGSSWVASRDGQFWLPVTALDDMPYVTADAEGLIGYRLLNGKLTLVRVVGENFQTTDKPATAFGFASDMISTAACRLLYDAASGLYILVFSSSINNPDLWYGTSFPESTAESPLLSDAGWSGLSLDAFIAGSPVISNVGLLRFAERDYFMCVTEGSGEDWPYSGYTSMGLRVGLVGKLLSEQLFASVRHKGQKADWSDWAADVPFTAELGAGDAGETEGLNQKNGATFHTRDASAYGNYLASEFVVPDGVTELLILCASGVSSSYQPGWAASCRVAVTPGQTIPVTVGGYNSTSKKVVTTSSVGGFISCDPATGVTCPSGALMQFQGATGYSSTYKGGGFAFVTDSEWLSFALHGSDRQPVAAQNGVKGLNVGWNGFDYLHSFCGGYSYVYGQSGIVKIWWGPQING